MKIRFGIFVLALVIILTTSAPLERRAHAAIPVAGVIAIATLVLEAGIDYGIDQAGKMVLGPQWPLFKKLMAPIFAQFPDLLGPGDKEDATRKAINALKSDPDFHALIDARIKQIGMVTTDLWIKVDALEFAQADHERRIAAIEKALATGHPIVIVPETPKKQADPFKTALFRFIEEANRSQFANLKGETCLWQSISGCQKWQTTVFLPGARTCFIPKKGFSGWGHDPIAGCDFFEPSMTTTSAKGTSVNEVLAGRARSLATAFVSPGREETLLAFVEVVRKIDAYIPPHWDRRLPEAWIMDPARWPNWVTHGGTPKNTTEPLNSAFPGYQEDRFYYSASERGGGRRVSVEYSSFTYSGAEKDRLTNVTVKFQ